MLHPNEQRDILINLFMFGDIVDKSYYCWDDVDSGTVRYSSDPVQILLVIGDKGKGRGKKLEYPSKMGRLLLDAWEFKRRGLMMPKLSRTEKKLSKDKQRLLKRKYKTEALILARKVDEDLEQGQRNVMLYRQNKNVNP